MHFQTVIVCLCAISVSSILGSVIKNNLSPRAAVTVQATNNTAVPSVTYIVDAVECLEEACSIYESAEDRANLYAALFQQKHNGTWNVVVGYTTAYIHSTTYVETMVNSGKDKKDDPKGELYLIFSSD